MKKKGLVILSIVILISVIIFKVAFAVNNIKLIVNDTEITPSIPITITKGEPVGAIKDISKALGAAVKWDKSNQIVTVTDTNKRLLERKVQLLENAFILDTPEEIAVNWARGIMTRNGALQYALLCDDLKKKTLPGYISFDWVTGTSSPWVDRFEIIKKEQQKDSTWKFTIRFHYTDSTGSSIYSTSTITVGKNQIIKPKPALPIYSPDIDDKWCITAIE